MDEFYTTRELQSLGAGNGISSMSVSYHKFCLTNIHEIDMMLNLFKNTKLITSHKEKISSLKINVEDFSSSIFGSLYLQDPNQKD